jgi:hypothetical protein
VDDATSESDPREYPRWMTRPVKATDASTPGG